MMKKSDLFLILLVFIFSLFSCETAPEERRCEDYRILKPSGSTE
ncbi:hypothetical protein [Borrelia sp. P9F1]|nr:hypothetical protein [Borrelia sp. P9F1]WKC57889.1 hypothetical protein QYZ68_01640 [Borrelia sp. P9F1]